MFTKFNQILKNLGPGLMYAGAAVGVSHLVSATKAGAVYGFLLLIFIPLIHIIKYPFYKFGPQYTAITGKNILHGYRALGKWALFTYMGMTIITMCLIQSAVTIVTASLALKIFGSSIPTNYAAIIVLLIAASVLFFGKYSLLDKLMKIVILTLTVTTIFALLAILFKGTNDAQEVAAPVFQFGNLSDALFLAAFLGWMPAPMDITVWHSVWAEEADRSSGKKANVKQAMFDFKIGFIGTACLAMCFLALGALVMYGSGETPSPKGTVFAGQLIELYTDSLGSWAYPVIGVAALATMISTTLTCLDAYPRTLDESVLILKNEKEGSERKVDSKNIYRLFLSITVAGTIIIFLFFMKNMGQLVTLATVVAFVSAPILALINYLVINGKTIDAENKPSKLMKTWSILSIICLFTFSIWYVWIRFVK
ncbi:divalent metal cation transporter [Lentisphaera profundi]|uniref:Divalent metal cation transporter n=1 Tax=Lentisphaera profundi TaxID=1658616 RepID=A0ABY7VSR5_9BACT|nr:divalent metal cation transporter [Lentisphaera profundi]WDE97250.1 divalent metal cation transporter [Lentisphaera profundi]